MVDSNSNEQVSVIGLGTMGAALARVVLQAGHDLTVWNRSPARMQPFIDDGVVAASQLAAAITASRTILICIDDNPAGDALLNTQDIIPHLAGRTVVQFSTSTPQEASESNELLTGHGASYLDGAFQCGPGDIGSPSAQILLSGDQAAYERVSPLLDCLGDIQYLGTNVRAAAVLDLAAVCEAYGRFMSITHAANMCESEGIGLHMLANMFPEDSFSRRYANVIHSSDFESPAATLRVWEAAVQGIRTQAHDASINADFPDYVVKLFEKAIGAGYGEEHVMALIKVLRKS